MKALQCESAKISPKDMHKGKDRKENEKSVKYKRKREKGQECEIVTTPRCRLGHIDGHRLDLLGGEGRLE